MRYQWKKHWTRKGNVFTLTNEAARQLHMLNDMHVELDISDNAWIMTAQACCTDHEPYKADSRVLFNWSVTPRLVALALNDTVNFAQAYCARIRRNNPWL